jgi:hypothetical protein
MRRSDGLVASKAHTVERHFGGYETPPSALGTFNAAATQDGEIYFQTAGFNAFNSCSGPEDFTVQTIDLPLCTSLSPFFPVGAQSENQVCFADPVTNGPLAVGFQNILVTCTPPSGGGTTTVTQEMGCPNSDNNGAWIIVSCTGSAAGIQVGVTVGLSDQCSASGPDQAAGTISSGVVAPGTEVRCCLSSLALLVPAKVPAKHAQFSPVTAHSLAGRCSTAITIGSAIAP